MRRYKRDCRTPNIPEKQAAMRVREDQGWTKKEMDVKA